MKKKIMCLPKGFFEKSRPVISMKEALKDVIPVEWQEEKKNKKYWQKSRSNKKIS